MGRLWLVAAIAVVLALVIGTTWWMTGAGSGDDERRPAQVRAAEPSPPSTSIAPAPSLAARVPVDPCSPPTERPFAPVRISIEGITPGATVIGLPRDAADVPGVVSFSGPARTAFAWDAPGIRPGSPRGNVLLNTHTWPDGSAMGNRLLRELDRGDRLVLRGPRGQRLCYDVTERLEVLTERAPSDRVYDERGRPQVVIIVCSGDRTGPGEWSHRTLWFASPRA